MARTVTLAQMRTWARTLSDTEGDRNVTDTELTALVNRHLCEVYDLLVEGGPPEYFAASEDVSVVAGTIQYALHATFRGLLGVYVHESSDERRELRPMPASARGRFKAPTAATTVTVEFIPAASVLSADGDTFDGVSGWEALIVNRVARDVFKKRDVPENPSVTEDIATLTMRIRGRAKNRDRGAPRRIADLDEGNSTWPGGWSSNSRLACYRLRAGNIEFFDSLWGLP